MKDNQEEHLDQIMTVFFQNVQGDPKLQQLFENYAHDRVKHHPKTFHAHAFGEGDYTHEQIQAAHKNISLDEDHFHSMIQHYVQTLTNHGYSEEEKEKALNMLMDYKDMVLGSK